MVSGMIAVCGSLPVITTIWTAGGTYDVSGSSFFGRRPAGVYLPRYRNVGNDKQQNFLRGYAFAGGGSRGSGDTSNLIGAPIKEAIAKPGPWSFWMTGMGECLPYKENRVYLDKTKTDAWGIPQLAIDCTFKENETAMLKDILDSGAEMLEKAGFKDIYTNDTKQAPGLDITKWDVQGWRKDQRLLF